MGHDDHTPQETADLTTLPTQTKRAAITSTARIAEAAADGAHRAPRVAEAHGSLE